MGGRNRMMNGCAATYFGEAGRPFASGEGRSIALIVYRVKQGACLGRWEWWMWVERPRVLHSTANNLCPCDNGLAVDNARKKNF